jgi:hypothetical protein
MTFLEVNVAERSAAAILVEDGAASGAPTSSLCTLTQIAAGGSSSLR